jgi:hypothetical protein
MSIFGAKGIEFDEIYGALMLHAICRCCPAALFSLHVSWEPEQHCAAAQAGS